MGTSPAASFYLLPALSSQSPSPGAMALTDLMGKALSGIPKSFYYKTLYPPEISVGTRCSSCKSGVKEPQGWTLLFSSFLASGACRCQHGRAPFSGIEQTLPWTQGPVGTLPRGSREGGSWEMRMGWSRQWVSEHFPDKQMWGSLERIVWELLLPAAV